MSALVLWLLALPLLTAILAAALGPGRGPAIRWLSLASTLGSLALALAITWAFLGTPLASPPEADVPTFHPELVTRYTLVPFGDGSGASGIQFYVGVDGINVWLVLLTALLMVTAVLVSWHAITERVNEFFAWMLLLQMAMEGVFLAFDMVLFYVFFELTLVPLFFVIGIWGGPQRQYAARKFFIYTLAGSLITFLGVLGVVLALALPEGSRGRLTFAIPELVQLVGRQNRELPRDVAEREQAAAAAKGADAQATARELARQARDRLDLWRRIQFWVFIALAVGFAIKVPLVPFHTWLPLAHVEAPTAGSVILAGVLLKIGSYGFLRLCVPLAPDASLSLGAPLVGTLAVIGILYGSFCALAQDDIKRLVAYSSVSHLGYCMLGMFALNEVGLSGSLLQMINHGLSTGALFLLVGMLYERYHTRKMADYGGMGARLHLLAVFWFFIAMTSIGLPGLNGFVSELLVMMGMYQFQSARVYGPTLAVLAAGGVVLGAWYMLTLLLRVFMGPVREPQHGGHGLVRDLDLRELATLVPIAVACVFLGIYPRVFIDTATPDLRVVARIAAEARERQGAVLLGAAQPQKAADNRVAGSERTRTQKQTARAGRDQAP
jgi:NADH-quinone oxidoreductase subunit M